MALKDWIMVAIYARVSLMVLIGCVLYYLYKILNAYYHALEAERHKLTSQFEEACVCLNMHLSKNWKGENRKKLEKRMIHILNKSKTLPHHIYDKEYNYTNEDEKGQEEDYAMHYYGAINRFGL